MLDHPSRSLPLPLQHTLPRGVSSADVNVSATATANANAAASVVTTTSYCPIKDITVMHNRFFPDSFPNTLTTTTLQNRRTAQRLPAMDTAGPSKPPLSPSPPPQHACSSPGSSSSTPPQTPKQALLQHPGRTHAAPQAPQAPSSGPNAATSASSRLKLKLTNQFFTEKADIKPWLQSRLSSLGINIVIERSDDTKIVFKCKYAFSQPPAAGGVHLHDHHSRGAVSKPTAAASNAASRKKKFCPFRIRANYSIRLKHWSLVIVNDSHNHPLPLINIEDVQDKLSEKSTTDCNNNSNNNSIEKEKQEASTKVPTTQKIAISALQPPSTKDTTNTTAARTSPLLSASMSATTTLASDMTRRSSGSVDSLLNTDSISIPNKLPPLKASTNLPANNMDYHLRQPHFFQSQHLDPAYRTQVRKIEDTLKGLEKIDSIPEDSKEKIFSNVLSVLNNSISEAALTPAQPQQLPAVSSSTSSSSSSISAFNLSKIINNPPSLHSPPFGTSPSHHSFKYTPAPLHSHGLEPSSSVVATSPPRITGKFGDTIILPSLDVLKRGLDNNVDLNNHGKPHNNHLTISLGYNNGLGKEYI